MSSVRRRLHDAVRASQGPQTGAARLTETSAHGRLSLLSVLTPARRRATGNACFDIGRFLSAGEQLVARQAYNLEGAGSSPARAISSRCPECGGRLVGCSDGESYCLTCGLVI